MRTIFFLVCSFILFSCKQEVKTPTTSTNKTLGVADSISYAKGFSIVNYDGYKIIKVTSAWPGSTKTFKYLLVNKNHEVPSHDENTLVIKTPVKNIVALSTTNIPTLEYLNVDDELIGFPNTKFISSEKTRKRIDNGKIKDLGNDVELNLELLLDLKPELVIAFSVNSINKKIDQIEKFGVPVVLDGAWTEQHPLGRAEWIKFIAAFFEKGDQAKTIFKSIETDYFLAKESVKTITEKPLVLSGSMFKDVWNIPGGKSFVAKYLEDANTDYLWKDNDKTGSLQLNFENVLERAKNAELWIGSGSFNSKQELEEKHKGYTFFDAYKNNNVFTYTNKKGSSGGLLYYELGPLRPDLILKDIIKIAHPQVLPNYETYFFKRLE